MYICRSHNVHLISMFRTLYGTLVVSHVICNISFGKDLQLTTTAMYYLLFESFILFLAQLWHIRGKFQIFYFFIFHSILMHPFLQKWSPWWVLDGPINNLGISKWHLNGNFTYLEDRYNLSFIMFSSVFYIQIFYFV